MPDEIDRLIEKLILIGAMEVSGISEDGEFLYGFTPKLKEMNESLFYAIQDSINNGIMDLWADGYLDIDMLESEPIVRLTEKALDEYEIAKLDPERQKFLRSIVERFEQ
jgi:hypothetical protein